MNRGEIWTVDLRSFKHAVLVAVLPNHPNVVLVPLRDDLAVTPTLVAVREPSTGLIADIASMTGLHRRRFLEHIGHLDEDTHQQLRTGLTAYLDL